MAKCYYHEFPDSLTVETRVVDARPGRVLIASSPFFPGGGGQLADRSLIRWAHGETAVAGYEDAGAATWILLAADTEVSGTVEAVVDPAFRQLMRELHTGAHILNALIYRDFNGALVTGVQLNDDGSARMDFDLPDVDNERLRALESPINDVIRQCLPISESYLTSDQALDEPGLIRTRSVAPPPTTDGRLRIVEIADLDRQACGGTHLMSTGQSRPIRISKIENKGRRNRRIRIAVESPAV